MAINLAIISILAIGTLAFIVNKITNLRICPICAGVAGTWLLMLVLRFLDYPISIPVLAILIGGSVVGIAYTIEKRLSGSRSAFLFKTLFIPVGFIGAWGIVEENWILAAVSVIALSVIASGFLAKFSPPRNASHPSALQKKLEKCC